MHTCIFLDPSFTIRGAWYLSAYAKKLRIVAIVYITYRRYEKIFTAWWLQKENFVPLCALIVPTHGNVRRTKYCGYSRYWSYNTNFYKATHAHNATIATLTRVRWLLSGGQERRKNCLPLGNFAFILSVSISPTKINCLLSANSTLAAYPARGFHARNKFHSKILHA